jgi:hypothetical protein
MIACWHKTNEELIELGLGLVNGSIDKKLIKLDNRP